MKRQQSKARRLPITLLLIAAALLASIPSCGSGKKAATPEQSEKQRQKMLKISEQEQREN
jgi:hypothetical protein